MGLFTKKNKFKAYRGDNEIIIINTTADHVAAVYDLTTKEFKFKTWYTQDDQEEIEIAKNYVQYDKRSI